MIHDITLSNFAFTRLRNQLVRLHTEQHQNLASILPHVVSGDPESSLQEIQSICRAWQLNDHYRRGYEQCARLLMGQEAEIIIHEAKEAASEFYPAQRTEPVLFGQ